LRILLEEPTKKATQKVFKATYSSYVDAQSALTHLQQNLEESTLKLNELEEQLKAIDDAHEKSRRELETEFQEIKAPLQSELEKLGTSLESKERVVRELSQKEQQLTSAVHNKRY
jgi:peptidoglycan hydrolase CwlO-like protein